MLCSWFEVQKGSTRLFKLFDNPAITHTYVPTTTYVCTLNNACIDETVSTIQQAPSTLLRFSPEHHKLAMAQEFVLTKECECFINSSTVTIDTSTNSDITLISDSSDSSESTIWKKIDHFHFYHQDHSILLSRNAWLNDNHVNCAQYLLKKQFTHLHGLTVLCVTCNSRNISVLSHKSLYKFCTFLATYHWVALSTLQYYSAVPQI